MNELYFACTGCKVYVDAGYRWCYWQLEHPGIVRRGEAVEPGLVLGHEPYWSPPEGEGTEYLLRRVFPFVRRFFGQHSSHHVIFCEDNDPPDDRPIHWLELGDEPEGSPRYLAETLALAAWDDVLAWDAAQPVSSRSSIEVLGLSEQARETIRAAFEHYAAAARTSAHRSR